MPDHDEQRLIAALRRHLDASADALDQQTRLRLARARRIALTPPARRLLPGWRSLAALATLVMLLAGVWQRPHEAPSRPLVVAASSATVPAAGKEHGEVFADDLEFYAWLGELPPAEQATP